MYRYKSAPILPLLMPSLVWSIREKEKIIYLTFDDGPHPEITPKVLDVLEEFGAKATFFCVGENVMRHPETFALIGEKGHKTGNHTYNHLNGWKTGNQKYFENTDKAQELIQSPYFRPPYGKITPRQYRVLNKEYMVIMWSLLSRDYKKDLDREQCKKALRKHSFPGAIVLFHDSEKAEKNVEELLPWYLETMSDLGYSFKALNI